MSMFFILCFITILSIALYLVIKKTDWLTTKETSDSQVPSGPSGHEGPETGDQGSTERSYKLDLPNFDNIRIDKGELYQPTPCQSHLVNDNGICKRPPGADCITSSECSQDYICFNSTCTRRPANWEECLRTACAEGLVCVDRHLMRLHGKKFCMLPGWWSLRRCIDICDSPFEDKVYVLTDEGICLVPHNKPVETLIKVSPIYIQDKLNSSSYSSESGDDAMMIVRICVFR